MEDSRPTKKWRSDVQTWLKYTAVHYYVLGTDNKGLTMRVARKRRGLNFCNVTVHADVPYFVSGLSKCEHHVFKHAAFPFFVTKLSTENLFTQSNEPLAPGAPTWTTTT